LFQVFYLLVIALATLGLALFDCVVRNGPDGGDQAGLADVF
jgi:hypothetical protein